MRAVMQNREVASSLGVATRRVDAYTFALGAGLAFARPSPNPSRRSATLRFTLPAAGSVRLEVLDVNGRRVWRRSDSLAGGSHEWSWDGRDDRGRSAGAGLYLVRLATP